MQKTYVDDFLTHRTRRNDGQLPQYFVKDDHDPIVSRCVFEQVGDELYRRSEYARQGRVLRYGHREALFGRTYCDCGGAYLRRRDAGASAGRNCDRMMANYFEKGKIRARSLALVMIFQYNGPYSIQNGILRPPTEVRNTCPEDISAR